MGGSAVHRCCSIPANVVDRRCRFILRAYQRQGGRVGADIRCDIRCHERSVDFGSVVPSEHFVQRCTKRLINADGAIIVLGEWQ
jgi:hypothetical protein